MCVVLNAGQLGPPHRRVWSSPGRLHSREPSRTYTVGSPAEPARYWQRALRPRSTSSFSTAQVLGAHHRILLWPVRSIFGLTVETFACVVLLMRPCILFFYGASLGTFCGMTFKLIAAPFYLGLE